MPPQENLPSHSPGNLDSAPTPAALPAEDIPATSHRHSSTQTQIPSDWDEMRTTILTASAEENYDLAYELAEAALRSLQREPQPRPMQICSAAATAAQIQEYRNEDAKAADLWHQALRLAKEASFPDPLVQPDILASLSLNLLRQSGGMKSDLRSEARRTLNSAVHEYRVVYQSFPGQFPSLDADDREDTIVMAKCGAVEALKQFSEVCSELRLRKGAEHFAQRACILCDHLLGPQDPLAFKSRWTLMNCARELKRYEQEELVIMRSLECAGQAAADSDSGYLVLQGRLADCLIQQKKFDHAYALAKPIVEKLQAENLDELSRSALSFLHRALGSVAANLKDWPEAKKHFALAISFEESRESITLGYLNGLQFSLARAMLRNAAETDDEATATKEEDAAEVVYKTAVALTDHESVGPTPEGIRAHRKLFDYYFRRERFQEADQQAIILQNLTKLVHGSGSAEYVDSFQWRSTVQASMGNYGRSEAIASKALEVARTLPDDSQDCIVNIYKELAGLAGESGADATAIEYLVEGVAFALELRGPNSFLLSQARLNLADEYVEAGDYSRAEKEARQAKRNLDKFVPTSTNFHELGRVFHILGSCASNDETADRSEEAFSHYQRAEESFEAAGSRNTLTYAHYLVDSGWLFAGRYDSTRQPDDLAAALTALRTGEGIFRKLNLHVSEAQLELVEKIVELLEFDGDDTAVSQYRELAEQIRIELGPQVDEGGAADDTLE